MVVGFSLSHASLDIFACLTPVTACCIAGLVGGVVSARMVLRHVRLLRAAKSEGSANP